MTCGIMLIVPEFLLIMGGQSYIEAIYVMPPVAFGCVCQFIYTMHVNIEQFKKKTVGMAIASISAAGLNYLLNMFLFHYKCAPIENTANLAYTGRRFIFGKEEEPHERQPDRRRADRPRGRGEDHPVRSAAV